MIQTMKEELVCSNGWMSYEQLREALDHWVVEYNSTYLHSAIGYMPPNEFEKKSLEHKTNSH